MGTPSQFTPHSLWDELRELREQMNRMLGASFRGAVMGGRGMEWSPAVDIVDRGDRLVATAELPGMKADDISIDVEGNTLTIRGEKRQEQEQKGEERYLLERQYGSFMRSFPLPRSVDPDRISARFDNGVLTVTMPKSEEAKGRRVKVEGGNG
jgi:HSP20 family protein